MAAVALLPLPAQPLAAQTLAAQAPATQPPETLNLAPTRRDWAAIGDRPDLSGVWAPGPLDRFPPGSTTAPPWTPEKAAEIAALQQLDKEGRPKNIYIDCLPEGLPSSVTQTLNSVEFLVTPGRVTILGELDGNRLRRIWTDGRAHPADPDPTFSGHSIGHWEENALIIDTVGILPQVFIPMSQGVGLPNNGDMHVEERITLVDANSLRWDITVHAPKVLSRPWTSTRTFARHRERAFDPIESSCRQGDFLDDVDAKGNAIYTPIPKDAGGAPVPPDQPNAPTAP
ncbi:hypothetical protein BH10PSE13_BH10PSE13_10430 [soil metagenome]